MFRAGLVILCVAMLMAEAPLNTAAAQSGGTVNEIVVQGNQRIEKGTVRSYLLLQKGDRFDNRRIDQSLKSLFATGLFADVTIKRDGNKLVVRVVENPVINRIAFEGNKRISDELLDGEVSLRARQVFTRTKVQKDVKRILDVYRINGRFAATVDPKVILLDQNRADLVFEIDEGPLTKVEGIRFIGNKAMSESDLRSVVRTKEAAWYRFFSDDDTYDPDRLTFDKELLRRFYLKEVYADFKINSAVAELTPDKKAFFITVAVDEGERYKYGVIDLAVGLRGLDQKQLRAKLQIKKGDWYNRTEVDTAIDNLTDAVGDLGFAFVEIRPRVNRNVQKKEINITFDISEGPRVFVERIEITGNVRTIDSVIRREFRLAEGDAFNSAKLRRSRKRINNLNFFTKVDVQRVPGSAPDKAVIKVEVEEKSTGSLSLGVGFATDAGPLVEVGIKESNLLGRGQNLSLSTSIAAERSQFDLSFTEPFFLDRDVAAGIDLFHTQLDLQDTRSYDSRRTGFGFRAGYPISAEWRQRFNYNFEFSEIEDVSSTASNLIKAQEGKLYTSLVGHTLTYDIRDSRINPREGFVGRMNNVVAGLGGNVRYLRNTFSATQYFPVTKKMVLSVGGDAGHIYGIGEDVRITNRFFIGGDSLRGFESAGVGPRDRVTKDALGGEWMYTGTVQLRFPLGLPDELGISGRIFTDFGSSGTVNPSSSDVIDTASVRASVGAGIGWVSPFGPINVDFGFPVVSEGEDIKETLRVNFGTRF